MNYNEYQQNITTTKLIIQNNNQMEIQETAPHEVAMQLLLTGIDQEQKIISNTMLIELKDKAMNEVRLKMSSVSSFDMFNYWMEVMENITNIEIKDLKKWTKNI